MDFSTCSGSYGSRGKGKRRFAAQGSWRSSLQSLQQGESEGVLWLHRPPDAPLPSTAPPHGPTSIGSKQSRRGKDEVHLTQLAREFWGSKGQSSFQASVVDGVYSVIVKTKYVYEVVDVHHACMCINSRVRRLLVAIGTHCV